MATDIYEHNRISSTVCIETYCKVINGIDDCTHEFDVARRPTMSFNRPAQDAIKSYINDLLTQDE